MSDSSSDSEDFDFGAKKKKTGTAKAAAAKPAASKAAAAAAAGGSDSDSDSSEDFDFGKKKKSAKKKAEPATKTAGAAAKAAAGGDDDDSDSDSEDFDFSGKKKKAAAGAAADGGADGEQANQDGGAADGGDGEGDDGACPWSGSDRDYTYAELVDRVFTILKEERPELAAGRKKRYTMKPPNVVRGGTKKTAWVNFVEMCEAMDRPVEHVLSYVLVELGTTASIDASQRLLIRGRYQPKQIENVVRHYISEYVTCRTCKGPKTKLIKDNRMYFVVCASCNSQRTVSTVRKGYEAQIGRRKRK